jgi:hypothetical protein
MKRFVALTICVVAVTPVGVAAAPAGRVTLRVHAPFDPGIQARNISFSGRVANGRAGELVELQAKECRRHSFYRLIAGTRTTSGGSWVIDNDRGGVDMFEIPLQASFRARWKGSYSNAVTVGAPLPLLTSWDRERRIARVLVSPGDSGFSLHGRIVVLQRETVVGWVRVRTARLRRSAAGAFVTLFRVPTRGLTLRVVASDATGAPCFTAAVSDTWRS